ncbi:unnamed protein product [Rotaria socialis]|uniref:DUF8206 domain-containing protein n=1 Tax=Rotaria socialis TaxID=392032 RepID=A0A820HTW1_9BILA|nr:unnamed protein product [Rotaria socialis]
MITAGDQRKANYTTKCHARCYLHDAEKECVGHEILQHCCAINKQRVAKLYHLPINGASIKRQVEELKEKQSTINENREHVVNIPSITNSSTTMQELRKTINHR